MKKYLGTTLFICVILLMASCKKDAEEALLSGRMSDFSTQKAYIDEQRYTCFIAGEKVRVNNSEGNIVSLSDNDRHCVISGVDEALGYYAFYPSFMVGTADLSGGFSDITIELPMAQLYHQTAGGKQIIENPMAAHLTTPAGLLQFHNLCALLKVSVQGECILNAIQVTVPDGIALWGTGKVKDIDGTPYLEMDGDQNGHNTITLYFEESRSIGASEVAVFYIMVPQAVLAAGSQLKVDVIAEEAYNGGYTVYHHPYAKTLSKASTIAANTLNTLGTFNLSSCTTRTLLFFPYSVSASQTVEFAKGNLQYNPKQDAYRMAVHQYDYIGTEGVTAGNVTGSDNKAFFLDSNKYQGWIDLFCWGTGGHPTADSVQVASFDEWGFYISRQPQPSEEKWYTLTNAEWGYLAKTRSASRVGSVNNAKYVKTRIENINGLLFFPDNFSCPAGISFNYINSSTVLYKDIDDLTMEEYAVLECAGCVFLPAAGERVVKKKLGKVVVANGNSFGRYWSSTPKDSRDAYNFWVGGSSDDNVIEPQSSYNKAYGYSVRLAHKVQQQQE